jgi:hypothetical protein
MPGRTGKSHHREPFGSTQSLTFGSRRCVLLPDPKGDDDLKRFLVPLATGALLLGLSTANHAQTYTILHVGSGGSFTSNNGDFKETNTPAPDFEYSVPSVVTAGFLDTAPVGNPTPGLSDTFAVNTTVQIEFGQGNGSTGFADGSDILNLDVTLAGDVGYSATGVPFSTAHLTLDKLSSSSGTNVGAVGVADVDPQNNKDALRLDLTYLGTPVQLWLDQVTSLPAPGAAHLNVSGFVNAQVQPPPVPEPDSPALLLGSGVTGGLLLIRRRRA